MTDEAAPAGPASSLARKLNRLFETIHPAGRGPYSPEEVAKAIAGQDAGGVSPAYIYLLRKGQRDNPTKRHLELLANFFGVPPAYFFDDAASQRIEDELQVVAALRDGDIRRLAAQASGLSPTSLDGLLRMIDTLRDLEGLPAQQPEPGLAQPGATAGN